MIIIILNSILKYLHYFLILNINDLFIFRDIEINLNILSQFKFIFLKYILFFKLIFLKTND
jgi:hypothetical protein